ncbi:hypothetical protein J7346_14635 [Brevundimonas sp. A19_0]|nr:hypothetical protein [Brevundimonas sp. A19_0]
MTVTGGVPPYTYVWQKVLGNPATFPTSPTGASTYWEFTGSPRFPWVKASTWRCLVTDSAASSVFTGNVSVSIDVS